MRLYIIFVLLSVLPLRAEDFRTYKAKYRPADELVRLAESLVSGTVKISAVNDTIVVHGSEKDAASVLKALALLDKKTRIYMARVRYQKAARGESGGISATVKGGSGSVAVDSRERQHRGRSEETLRVSEGEWAELANSKQFSSDRLLVRIRGTGTRGAQVQIKKSGASAVSTEVTVPFAQWQYLASAARSTGEKSSVILGKDESAHQEKFDLHIKVDRQP